MNTPAVMKSLNVIASSTDVPIFPPAAQALSFPKAISSAGLEPVFCELVPLTLEEMFISETEVVGYEVKTKI